MLTFNYPYSVDYNILREIGTKQSEQLIIIQSISDVGLGLKYFTEIIEKTLPIYDRLAEGAIRFKHYMLTFITLVKVLSQCERGIYIILSWIQSYFPSNDAAYLRQYLI